MPSIRPYVSAAILLCACAPTPGVSSIGAQTPESALENVLDEPRSSADGAKEKTPDPLAPLYRKLAPREYLHLDKLEFEARLQRRDAVYFAIDGPVVAQAAVEGPEPHRRVSVVAIEGDMVRILYSVKHGILLFWLPRENLMTVIGEEVRLVHEPGQKPTQDNIGVTLFPGAMLSRLGSRDGFTEVQGDGIYFFFHGWVPNGTFRDIYRLNGPARSSLMAPEDDLAYKGNLRPGALVHAKPGGRVIAVAAKNPQRTVYTNKSETVGMERWWLIEFNDMEFQVRGYVHSSDVDLHTAIYRTGGYGYGRAGPSTVVPADTCLLDRPDGDIVGRTVSNVALAVTAEPDGGYRVETESVEWGTVSVFLQPDSTDIGNDGLPTRWLDCSAPE